MTHDQQNSSTKPDLKSGMHCPRLMDLRVMPSVSKGNACAAHLAADLYFLTECCSSLALAAAAAVSQPPCLAPATGRDKLAIGVLIPLGLTGSGNSCAAASAVTVQTDFLTQIPQQMRLRLILSFPGSATAT